MSGQYVASVTLFQNYAAPIARMWGHLIDKRNWQIRHEILPIPQ
jgi:hypothetical protein